MSDIKKNKMRAGEKKRSKDKSEVYVNQKNTISINKAIAVALFSELGSFNLYSDDNPILNSEWVWKFMNGMQDTYYWICNEECSYMLLLFQEHFAKIWSLNAML